MDHEPQTPPPAPSQTPSLSHLLANLRANMQAQGRGTHITVADLLSGIKTEARAILLIVFALPNVVPSLPGTSAITGLPLVILTLQMMLGQKLWLPSIIADRAVPRDGLAQVLTKANPYFVKVERRLHPRFLVISTRPMQRILGAGMLILSVMIMLPIPLGNIVPAISILLIALGLTQRDGIFILTGIATAIGSTALLAVFYWTALQWAVQWVIGALA